MIIEALIFDCDGVLVDTEKDGHRVAFNKAFAEFGLDIEWDVALYGELLKVAGGKERMISYFDRVGWPDHAAGKDQLIKDLHRSKTDHFLGIIEKGEMPLRPGVARIVDEAIADRITLAVCSTSNERAVNMVVEKMLGSQRRKQFAGIFAGDMASRKKPDPEIYNIAAEQLNLDPRKCVVIEDSRNGLLAAKAAGMNCIVTKSNYTTDEDFSEADRVIDQIGDDPAQSLTLIEINDLIFDPNLTRKK